MKNLITRFTEWIQKLDRLIQKRVDEIIELNTSQNEMSATNHESYAQNKSPLTDKK